MCLSDRLGREELSALTELHGQCEGLREKLQQEVEKAQLGMEEARAEARVLATQLHQANEVQHCASLCYVPRQ